MTAPVRFTVITDDPARVAREMFRGEVPPFVRVVSEPREVLDLSDGTLAFARLFSVGGATEVAFDIMNRRGALRVADNAFFDRLDGWLDRRDAARFGAVSPVAAVSSASGQPAPAGEAVVRGARARKAAWK